MDKVQELRAKRAEKVDALEALAEKMNADDYVEVEGEDDQGDYETLKKDIEAFDGKIKRTEDAQRIKATLAVPAPQGVLPAKVEPQARRAYGLKGFKDKMDGGVLVRGDEQAYRFGQFLAAHLFHNEKAAEFCRMSGIQYKAQVEGVNASGGVLVPDEWLNTIINLKEQFGVFRKYAQIVPMNRDSVHWPRRTGGVTAFFVGEGTAPTESTATWDDVNLVAKKMASLVRISTELAEDAMINVADWIVTEIAYAFASKEDDCGFLGDGTSTFGGIQGLVTQFATNTKGVFTATGHTTFDALTAPDMTGWMGLLPQYALPNAKFYCSQSFYAYVFERLALAGGGNTIQTIAGAAEYRWLGVPIVISQKLPVQGTVTGTIVAYYGDLQKAAAMGERRMISIKRSDERYFDTDQIGIMGTERIDIVVHDVGTTTVTGPMVALKMG